MEYQRQFITKLVNSMSLLRKHSGHDIRPSAAILDQNPEIPPPHCAICLTDICGGDSYRRLTKCGHCFHAHCIDLWFQSRSTCPLCRVQVPGIISLNEAQYHQWNVVWSCILLLLQDFFEKICDPLNDELNSMLSGNMKHIS